MLSRGKSMINLEAILESAEREVKSQVKAPLTQEEFSTFVAEAYARLYYYQKEVIDLLNKENIEKGRIISPTGSGKDIIMNSIYLNDIFSSKNTCNNYLKVSHRLSLNVQLLVSMIKYIPEDVNIAFIGSGGININKLNKKLKLAGSKRKIKAKDFVKTTNAEVLRKFINKDDNMTFIVATYHSLDVVSGIDVKVACFDEAHTIVSRDVDNKFITSVRNISNMVQNAYFFTATQKVYGVDGGMNDEELFGPVIFDIPAKELIDGGYIATPKIHFVRPTDDNHGDLNTLAMEEKTILDSFKEHDAIIKKDSACHPDGSSRGKMLVNSSGSTSMKEMLSSKTMKDFSIDSNTKIYFIASHDDVLYKAIINGEIKEFDREDWMDEVAALEREDAAIIFHIRILTEGIDLPNITGVLFTRPKDLIDFLQSIGRGLRRTVYDRNNILHTKTVGQLEVEKQEKPYGYVILPCNFLISEGDVSDMITILLNLVTTYKMSVHEMVLETGDSKGIIDKVMPAGTNLSKSNSKKIKGAIKELEHIFVDIYGSELNFDNSIKVGEGEFVEYNDGAANFDNIIASELIKLAELRKIKEVCTADTTEEFADNIKGLFGE